MNKSSKRWKVFVLVLCMLFTMTPATVFADNSDGPLIVLDPTGGQPLVDPGTPTPPDPGTPTPPNPEPPAPPVLEKVTLPAIDTMNMETMHCAYYGTITIEKKVTDKPEFVEDAEFTFIIEKRGNWNNKEKEYDYEEVDSVSPVTITGSDTTEKIEVETGHYRVTETTVNANYSIYNSNKSQVQEVKKDKNTHYKFINKYIGPTTGYITITKEIDGDQPSTDATFKFLVKRQGGSDHYVTIPGEGSATVGPLYLGKTYKVTEVNIPNNYTPDASEKEVLVKVGQNSVTFTNTYTDPTKPTTGSLEICKEVSFEGENSILKGESTIAETVFDFNVTSSENNYSETVSVTGGACLVINNLKPGEYVVTEEHTMDFYPEDNDYEKLATVEIDGTATVKFKNYYDPDEPAVSVTKEVALYDGVIPENGFGKSLTLSKLNKQVIYRVSYSYNDAWERSNRYVSLADKYDRKGTISDITSDLKIWSGGEFITPQGINANETYYYIDTLPANGTYTNTAYLCEPQYKTVIGDGESGYDSCAIASSSAVVVVNYSSGGGGGGGGSTHYYEVIYNANYPTGAGISGDVPKDTKDYTYNTTVSVKGNAGDLKAGTYTFIGWNTKADGTGTMYLPGSTFKITADTILYAQWKLADETATTVADPNTGTGDGNAVAAETAKAAGLDDVPKTGTSNPLLPMFLLGLLSLAGITLGRKKILE